jgi:undecaprenyl diphosphate synthase
VALPRGLSYFAKELAGLSLEITQAAQELLAHRIANNACKHVDMGAARKRLEARCLADAALGVAASTARPVAVPAPTLIPSSIPASPSQHEHHAPPPAVLDRSKISSLPVHIAIVMDGNGRWAQQQGLSRSEGHKAGVAAIHRTIRACRRLGIQYLTLYAFSSQNWSRPSDEVRTLMKLLIDFVNTECEELVANGVRLLINGEIGRLPAAAREGLERLIEVSKNNRSLTLCLALSYGGREEIVAAAADACRAAAEGRLDPDTLTVASFRRFLPHPGMPDPDLLIRTSGEMRVSNFLLWHIAYSEIWVTSELWPDFDDRILLEALVNYAGRERRFGKTSAQIQDEEKNIKGNDKSYASAVYGSECNGAPSANGTDDAVSCVGSFSATFYSREHRIRHLSLSHRLTNLCYSLYYTIALQVCAIDVWPIVLGTLAVLIAIFIVYCPRHFQTLILAPFKLIFRFVDYVANSVALGPPAPGATGSPLPEAVHGVPSSSNRTPTWTPSWWPTSWPRWPFQGESGGIMPLSGAS